MKIVVTGSLGRIGRPLTAELIRKKHSVTVISSKPERQEEIEAMGATAAIGEIEDIDFLTSVFTGADVVHAMIPPTYNVPDPMAYNMKVGRCLAEAIRRSGVKRVVYISSYGAEHEKGTGLIVGHHHIEKELLALSNLEALTLLRATYIYYNLYAYVDMIKATRTIAVNYGGDDRIVLVSPIDIAAAAVEEIESGNTGTKVRYVASDERTCDEIVQVLSEAIGMPDLKWITVSDEEMQAGMEANGLSRTIAGQLVELYRAAHNGLLNQDYDRQKPHQLGKVKLEDFAREFAANFNRK
jgi:uncharacterized protein YbjT (DUF2867 family)